MKHTGEEIESTVLLLRFLKSWQAVKTISVLFSFFVSELVSESFDNFIGSDMG